MAAGGTGKGHLLIGLAIDVALGRNFGPFEVNRPRGVLFVSREDNRDEFHRRLQAALEARWPEGPSADVRAALAERFHFADLVGVPGCSLEGPMAEEIVDAAARIRDCGLIILDPLGKLLPEGVVLNSQEGAGRVHDAVDRIVAATGCSVIMPHHINKVSEREHSELQSQAATGSWMLVDLARAVFNLRTVPDSEVTNLGVEDTTRHFLELALSKSNYAPALSQRLIFERMAGGALLHRDTRDPLEVIEERVLEVLKKASKPLTREEWEDRCAKLKSKIGRNRARDARTRLKNAGLVEVVGHRGKAELLAPVAPGRAGTKQPGHAGEGSGGPAGTANPPTGKGKVAPAAGPPSTTEAPEAAPENPEENQGVKGDEKTGPVDHTKTGAPCLETAPAPASETDPDLEKQRAIREIMG